MTDLNGSRAIVTGGSRGIGAAIAEALVREGARVAITGRNRDRAEAKAADLGPTGQVRAYAFDVRDLGAVEDFFGAFDREFNGLDILVNNAGVGHFGRVDKLTSEEWNAVIETNLNAPFHFTRLAVPRMSAGGGGFILNIGSLAGKYPFAGGAAYNASKFALAGFTESCMLDLRHLNIRVSTIMPGSVETGFRGAFEPAAWKLDPASIADMAVHLFKTPIRNLASRIEMRPSKPPRK